METVEDIFKRIMDAQKWEKQQLAEHIGVHPSTLSQKLGTHWNAHWRVFVKLLPLMIKLQIIRREQLDLTSDIVGPDSDNTGGSNKAKSKDNQTTDASLSKDIMETLTSLSFILQ